jgi:hypothetical protein
MPLQLKDAMVLLESGAWLSMRVLTANTARKTGGEVREFAKVRMRKNKQEVNISVITSAAPAVPRNKQKAPNHHENFTRNVETQAGDIIKIHPILITHLNNKQVV